MVKMSNNEVVEAFLNRQNAVSYTGSLTSVNGRLYSYYTCIAEFAEGLLYVNKTKYSMTTSSKHQSPLFRQASALYRDNADIVYVNNVPFGHKTLTDCKIVNQ